MTIRVLVVCAADRCRGPAAVALLLHHLESQSQSLEVWSAGTVADEGGAAHTLTVEALNERGVRLRGGASRRLLADDLAGADLVLAAERMHRLHVARMAREAAAKTFTLAELARIVPHLHEAGLRKLLDGAVALRPLHPAARPADDDLVAPVDSDFLDHSRMVRRLAEMIVPISHVLAAAAEPGNAGHARATPVPPEREILLPGGPAARFER